MASRELRMGVVAAMALAGLIAAGANVAAASKSPGTASDTRTDAMRCDIRQSLQGGAIILEPIVQVDRSVSGAYSLSLSGGGAGGSSSISQGGDFTAAAGRTTTLGRLSVGADGAAYSVRLKVTADGTSVTCARRVTSAL